MPSSARIASLFNKGLNALPAMIKRPRHLLSAARGVHWATLEMLDQPWIRDMKFTTVIDVGANTGQFASAAHTVFPDARIYSFEPLAECFEKLSARMNHIPNFTAFNVAVGASAQSAVMHKSAFSESSSLLPMESIHRTAFPWTSDTTPECVEVQPLDSFLNHMELINPVLLKLDVQGFELPALEGAQELLNQVDAVLVEVSFQELYEGEAAFESIQIFMTSHNFRLAGMIDQLLHPHSNKVLQADALYLRQADEVPL